MNFIANTEIQFIANISLQDQIFFIEDYNFSLIVLVLEVTLGQGIRHGSIGHGDDNHDGDDDVYNDDDDDDDDDDELVEGRCL